MSDDKSPVVKSVHGPIAEEWRDRCLALAEMYESEGRRLAAEIKDLEGQLAAARSRSADKAVGIRHAVLQVLWSRFGPRRGGGPYQDGGPIDWYYRDLYPSALEKLEGTANEIIALATPVQAVGVPPRLWVEIADQRYAEWKAAQADAPINDRRAFGAGFDAALAVPAPIGDDVVDHYRIRAERAEQHIESMRAALAKTTGAKIVGSLAQAVEHASGNTAGCRETVVPVPSAPVGADCGGVPGRSVKIEKAATALLRSLDVCGSQGLPCAVADAVRDVRSALAVSVGADVAEGLTFGLANCYPDGTVDASEFWDIEDALDRAEAPTRDGTRYLHLPERIAALAASRTAPARGTAEDCTDAERWRFTQRPGYFYTGPHTNYGEWSGYSVGIQKTPGDAVSSSLLSRGCTTLTDAIDAAMLAATSRPACHNDGEGAK